MFETWTQAHREALRRGATWYADPATGLAVFTERAHEQRGWCCGSGCRHCPWVDEKTPPPAPSTPDPDARPGP